LSSPRTIRRRLPHVRQGWLALGLFILAPVPALKAGEVPKPSEATAVLRDFRFGTGETLPEVRIHYRTLGRPRRDDKGVVRNAVLVLHGTGGTGKTFFRKEFAGELFGKGQPLDADEFYVIVPDNLGHGRSSKPSDGLRARFPRYGYQDMVAAQHRLLTEALEVNHLRLVIGTSMGGMHTWLWGQKHPEFMDALMPLASLPAQISGRNRMWRRLVIDAIRTDPEWKGGDYARQPRGLRTAAQMIALMGSNPVQRQKEGPTLEQADKAFDKAVAKLLESFDANDVLYAVEASRDYDPGPGLEKIKAPLVAVNFADDLINPPELGILEREVRRVPRGEAILMAQTEKTRGHGTHTLAAVWKEHLVRLLKNSER